MDEELCRACGHPPADGHTGENCRENCSECVAASDPKTRTRFRYQVLFDNHKGQAPKVSNFRSKEAAHNFIRLLTYEGRPADLWDSHDNPLSNMFKL